MRYFWLLTLLLPLQLFGQIHDLSNTSLDYADTLGVAPLKHTYINQYQNVYNAFSSLPSGDVNIRMNTLVRSLVDGGVWDSLDVFCVLGVQDTTSAKLNWIDTTSILTFVNNPIFTKYAGFNSAHAGGTYINAGALTGLAHYDTSNAFVGLYVQDWINNPSYLVGTNDGNAIVNFYPRVPHDNMRGRLNNLNDYNDGLADSATTGGFYAMNRLDSDSIKYYLNGTKINTEPQNMDTIPTTDMVLLNYNNNGTVDNTSIIYQTIGLYAVGALSDVQVTTLSNAVTTFFNALDDYEEIQTYDDGFMTWKLNSRLPRFQNWMLLDQVDNYKLARYNDSLYFSYDDGINWVANTVDSLDIEANINSYSIFPNGDVVFFIKNRPYVSHDSLATIDTLARKFTHHTPQDWDHPGSYYQTLRTHRAIEYNDTTDILVFGNYGNVGSQEPDGAVPTNIYYVINADSIKIAYQFGQNSQYTDDGSAGGGAGGTALGDAANDSLQTRHTHAVAFNSSDSMWYAITGDTKTRSEIHWIKGDYDVSADTWTWYDVAINKSEGQAYKTTDLSFDNDTVYFISDATSSSSGDSTGIFKCAYTDIDDVSKHQRLTNTYNNDIIPAFHKNGDTIIFEDYDEGYVYVSVDNGYTWYNYKKTYFGNDGVGAQAINFSDNNGWYNFVRDKRYTWGNFAGKVSTNFPKDINYIDFLSSNYFNVVDSGDLDIGTNDLTLSCWFLRESNPASYEYLCGKAIAGNVEGRYGFYIYTDGKVDAISQNSGGVDVLESTGDVCDSTWHHLVMTIEIGGYMKLFVDNVIADSVSISGDTYAALDGKYEFNIGTANNSSGSGVTNNFNGNLADVRLFHSALNRTQIDSLYNQQTVTGYKAWWPLNSCDAHDVNKIYNAWLQTDNELLYNEEAKYTPDLEVITE